MRLSKLTSLIVFPVYFGFIISALLAFNNKETDNSENLRRYVLENIDKVIANLNYSKKIIKGQTNLLKLKTDLIYQYHSARINYKKIEFFIEFFSSTESRFYINGPLVPKYDVEVNENVFEPMGFQVIEENLFGNSALDTITLNKQLQILLKSFTKLKTYYKTITIEPNKISEAMRLELIRLMCLTINGYDCTINKESGKECLYVLQSIDECVHLFNINNNSYSELKIKINNCKNYLNKNKNSDKIDRLYLITEFINPIYKNLSQFFSDINIEPSQINYAVNFEKPSLFSISSINKQHFSLYRNDTFNIGLKAELGKLLFFDPILSGNNKRACASCHKPELAFSDGKDKSLSFDRINKINRNSPTLLNALFQKLYFYDGRAFNLEEQAGEVFLNTFEMNTSPDEIRKKLNASDEYKLLFNQAYKGSIDTSITFYAVMHSIAEFIKTLDSKKSRFDKYIEGDHSQLNKDEKNGFNLFTGKALCGSCHFFPLFNGLVPPMYNDNEFEVIGTPSDSNNLIVDTDIGREKLTKSPIHRAAFKTPTIRNISYTGPYMHNGSFRTLDNVLEFYNKGGGAGLKFNVSNQTLPFDSLSLSKKELSDLKSFLLSLNDTIGKSIKPSRLPKFNNPKLDSRVIGGEY